jgi:hypothetical protein
MRKGPVVSSVLITECWKDAGHHPCTYAPFHDGAIDQAARLRLEGASIQRGAGGVPQGRKR